FLPAPTFRISRRLPDSRTSTTFSQKTKATCFPSGRQTTRQTSPSMAGSGRRLAALAGVVFGPGGSGDGACRRGRAGQPSGRGRGGAGSRGGVWDWGPPGGGRGGAGQTKTSVGAVF